ncbi:MAG TPA: aminotransferase class III-fold pyridoxal phosphate-dependent enzyme, partial [Methylomirabilota bacterium]|nr:aminotransferase class III-fold pyridoxal phosphate-dependent enzyme [Methylomirabilota bacterium]
MPQPTPMFMRGPHDPIRIERAEGPWLYASDGNKILDAGAGAVVVNIGQGRREIAEVAARTIANLDYIVPVWTSPEREKLVDRLTRWTPAGLTRFFFTSGGSEAVEAALKFAILYNKARGKQSKSKIIGRRFSYHGNTIAALSAGGSGRRADYEHILLDWPKIDPTYCYRCPWGKTYPSCEIDCATALEKEILKHGPDSIAAFIAEPMMGSSGGVVPPVKEYWPKIREICTRYNVLLIADEVMTGFRLALGGAVERYGMEPDLITLGKIVGGGLPVGVFGGKRELMDLLAPLGPVYQAGTLSGNPLAMAAGIATVDFLQNHAHEVYPRLEATAEAVAEGVAAEAARAGIPLTT